MAKKRRTTRARRRSGGRTVAKPSFGGKKFICRGKRVRVRKSSSKRSARVYCARKQRA